MILIDKTFSQEEIACLKKIKGHRINNIQGTFRFDDADVWNTLRINADNMSIDINLIQEDLPVSEEDDESDATGVFSIKEVTYGELVVDVVPLEVKTKQIQEIVENVVIFESQVKYFEKGELYYQNNIIKAIAFKLSKQWMILDRKVWFDEAITITFCDDCMAGIRDDSIDWRNEDDEESGNLTMEYELKNYEIE